MPRSLYTVSAWGDDCPVWLDDSAAQRPVLLIALFWNRVLNTILITRQSVTACFVVALIFAGLRPLRSEDATLLQQEDTRNSLQVLYDFRGIQGKRIPDRSGKFPALDLQVEKMDQVELGDGVLAIRGATKIREQGPGKATGQGNSENGGHHHRGLVATKDATAGWPRSDFDVLQGFRGTEFHPWSGGREYSGPVAHLENFFERNSGSDIQEP